MDRRLRQPLRLLDQATNSVRAGHLDLTSEQITPLTPSSTRLSNLFEIIAARNVIL